MIVKDLLNVSEPAQRIQVTKSDKLIFSGQALDLIARPRNQINEAHIIRLEVQGKALVMICKEGNI